MCLDLTANEIRNNNKLAEKTSGNQKTRRQSLGDIRLHEKTSTQTASLFAIIKIS